jgi:hypothetical protein
MHPKHVDVSSLARAFDVPPSDLDPHAASDRLLLRHGFPRRPDPEREPQPHRRWKRAFRPGTKMIKAELAYNEIMSRRNPLHKKALSSSRRAGGAWLF